MSGTVLSGVFGFGFDVDYPFAKIDQILVYVEMLFFGGHEIGVVLAGLIIISFVILL